VNELGTDRQVRIFREPNDRAWYLRDADTGAALFSFDLPPELFLEYANEGMLTARAALDMKEQEMGVASFRQSIFETRGQ
jgi:hypothetical protein